MDLQDRLNAAKENHERRMVRLAEMIDERRQLISDHSSGRRLMNDEALEKANRQFRAFEQKLERMKTVTDDVSADGILARGWKQTKRWNAREMLQLTHPCLHMGNYLGS